MGDDNNQQAPERVVFVGFDAMDHTLAAQLADDGVMPNLKGLLDSAPHAIVNNPVGFVVGAIWPSFWTSRWPASHGRHCYVQLTPGTYDFETVTPWEIDGTPFWVKTAEAGVSPCVVDIPFTTPASSAGGVQVFDWGSHDRRIAFQTFPEDEAAAIEARFGLHPVQPRCDPYARSDEWVELRDGLIEGAKSRTDMLLEYPLANHGFVGIVYGESHCAGHQFWKIHDADYVDHDHSLHAALGDPLVDLYAALDSELGRVIDANPDALTYVFLSHGMGPHHDGDHLLPEVLRRLDRPSAQSSAKNEALTRAKHRAKALLRPLVPLARRRARFEGRKRAVQARRHDERVSARFFHHVNNTMYSGIRLNIEGREPSGTVRPSDVRSLTNWLIDEIGALVDHASGHSVVTAVHRVSDLYSGPHLDELPDLVVDWNREAPIDDVSSPSIGRVTGKYASSRSGDHRLDGLLLVTGPGSHGVRLDERIDLVDIGPSIAAHFGVELNDVDGKPIPSLAQITV